MENPDELGLSSRGLPKGRTCSSSRSSRPSLPSCLHFVTSVIWPSAPRPTPVCPARLPSRRSSAARRSTSSRSPDHPRASLRLRSASNAIATSSGVPAPEVGVLSPATLQPSSYRQLERTPPSGSKISCGSTWMMSTTRHSTTTSWATSCRSCRRRCG